MKKKGHLSGSGEDLDSKIHKFINENGNTCSRVIAHAFDITINRALRRLEKLQKFGIVELATAGDTRIYRCTKKGRDTSPV